jgi:hypothetical protein
VEQLPINERLSTSDADEPEEEPQEEEVAVEAVAAVPSKDKGSDWFDYRIVLLFGFLLAVVAIAFFAWTSQYGVIESSDELNVTMQYAIDRATTNAADFINLEEPRNLALPADAS